MVGDFPCVHVAGANRADSRAAEVKAHEDPTTEPNVDDPLFGERMRPLWINASADHRHISIFQEGKPRSSVLVQWPQSQ